jgi:hypothetical protein
MWHLLFGVNSFFRFASKKPDQHAAFFCPRRAVLRREANYSKARFWNARGGEQNSLGCPYTPAHALAGRRQSRLEGMTDDPA